MGRHQQSTRRGLSVAQISAIALGVAFIALAVIEIAVGKSGLKISGHLTVRYTTQSFSLYVATGIILAASALAGDVGARWVLRVVGVIYLALLVWGVGAESSLGKLLKFPKPIHPHAYYVPKAYDLIHGAAGVAALVAGFARGGHRRRW